MNKLKIPDHSSQGQRLGPRRRRLDQIHRQLDSFADLGLQLEGYIVAQELLARYGVRLPCTADPASPATDSDIDRLLAELDVDANNPGVDREAPDRAASSQEVEAPKHARIQNLKFPERTLAHEVHRRVRHQLHGQEILKRQLFADAYQEALAAYQIDHNVAVAAQVGLERAHGLTDAREALGRPRPRLWRKGRPLQGPYTLGFGPPEERERFHYPTPFKSPVKETIAGLARGVEIGDIIEPILFSMEGASRAYHADSMRPPLEAVALAAKIVHFATRIVAIEFGHSAGGQALSLMLPTTEVWTPTNVFPEGRDLPEKVIDGLVVNIPNPLSIAFVEILTCQEDAPPRASYDLVFRHARHLARKKAESYQGAIGTFVGIALAQLVPGSVLVVMGDDRSGSTHSLNLSLHKLKYLEPLVVDSRDLVARPVWVPVPERPLWSPITRLPPTGRVVSAWRRS